MTNIKFKEKIQPIGDAIMDLKGGILRAEQVLDIGNLNWIKEERMNLSEKIQNCRRSLENQRVVSIPGRILINNAPIMLSSAEAILQKLSLRLSSSMRLIACDSKE